MALDIIDFIELDRGRQAAAVTAHNAAQPEHVKETAYLAKSLYAEDVKKTATGRGLRGIVFLLLTVATSGLAIVSWIIVEKAITKSAKARCYAQAKAIVSEKLARETLIQQTLYRAALAQLGEAA
jgi:hypothetical protein